MPNCGYVAISVGSWPSDILPTEGSRLVFDVVGLRRMKGFIAVAMKVCDRHEGETAPIPTSDELFGLATKGREAFMYSFVQNCHDIVAPHAFAHLP